MRPQASPRNVERARIEADIIVEGLPHAPGRTLYALYVEPYSSISILNAILKLVDRLLHHASELLMIALNRIRHQFGGLEDRIEVIRA